MKEELKTSTLLGTALFSPDRVSNFLGRSGKTGRRLRRSSIQIAKATFWLAKGSTRTARPTGSLSNSSTEKRLRFSDSLGGRLLAFPREPARVAPRNFLRLVDQFPQFF